MNDLIDGMKAFALLVGFVCYFCLFTVPKKPSQLFDAAWARISLSLRPSQWSWWRVP